jgi:cyclophilin family peptidyl-prolyl cis-trans isomerase
MANQGRNTNGSQFFISLKQIAFFDTQFVAFGRVSFGSNTLELMEKVSVDVLQHPLKEISIIDCFLISK